MKTYQESIVLMIDDIETYEMKLTDWERKFIDSINHFLSNGSTLTDKQTKVLIDIWDRVTPH